ncbi:MULTISPECIES: hypothetical protein [Bacillaceae]|uniref:Uncharacterized protein n=1 Tax=Domibacillus aminovorans TaxID=29332 RepID=A0A177KWS2_9BACI|nr:MULTISPECIES: hypothetical protein [Bacillaceae]OAH57809.1 hypothetical protein AWH48_01985 [Domibacillus aminovorans]
MIHIDIPILSHLLSRVKDSIPIKIFTLEEYAHRQKKTRQLVRQSLKKAVVELSDVKPQDFLATVADLAVALSFQVYLSGLELFDPFIIQSLFMPINDFLTMGYLS